MKLGQILKAHNMTSSDDPRVAYWDKSYTDYWLSRVAEADSSGGSDVQQGDAKTEGDWVYEEIFSQSPFKPGNILDVGCAWGRMFPLFLERGLQVSGVDISPSMIKLAQTEYGNHAGIDRIEASIAEALPFESDYFDNLTCLAVFDCTYQHQSLAEFLRVLKPGGRLYITGKSDNYASDDDLAIAAEKGARSKGHPNYFTDVKTMREVMAESGCLELASYFFPRRGDFAEFNYLSAPKDTFYEWCLVWETPQTPVSASFETFSSDYSKTYLELK